MTALYAIALCGSVPTEYQQQTTVCIMVRQDRRPQADVIEEILERLSVMREEMLILERKLERVKPAKRKFSNVKERRE